MPLKATAARFFLAACIGLLSCANEFSGGIVLFSSLFFPLPVSLPGERCPDLSPERSAPVRPELPARRLFKVPESPLEHARVPPALQENPCSPPIKHHLIPIERIKVVQGG